MVGARQRPARGRAAHAAARRPDPRPVPEVRSVPRPWGAGPSGVKQVAGRAGHGREIERRVTLSRDRRIITRKRNKLTVAAAAGAISVAAVAAAPPARARPWASPTASPSPSPSPSPAPAASGSPQSIAQSMLKSFGWSSSQFSCLKPLWQHESGWNVSAASPSGAYGIPQASPGSKMASAGPDWKTNASTQIKWGLGYIKSTYGSPCAAWSHEQTDGWY